MKSVEVVAAIIKHEDKILCVQRGVNKFSYISKKYEFPGGKIEIGESMNEALKREIFEELQMQIDIQHEFLTVKHQYPDFILTMHSFICNCETPSLTLTEHIDYKWLKQDELGVLDWAAADVPIIDELLKLEL
jgi:8-oxo-dGTP diphosphatase